jgi:thioester reductase-like protein
MSSIGRNASSKELKVPEDIDPDQISRSDIAVVGFAGRFSGAKDVATFWKQLCDGVESIACFSDQEVLSSGVDPAIITNPHYVKSKGVLDDIELFDAAFFGISPREAEIMDPQHRLFLETTWEALEHAGYNPLLYPDLIGIYAGVSVNSYLLNNLIANPDLVEVVGPLQLSINNDKDFLTTLVAYKLNLRGPSITIQTACSTSLVATCLACQSLLNYQCDIALAGGVSVKVPHKVGYVYQEGGILSPDGHCRAFDAQAGGSIEGNGLAVVVLKRLVDAIADGDSIHAVIKGTAINNDGSLKVSYTAPSVDAQAEVIAMAHAVAGVNAETIRYIETHGAATLLGDPIEIAALTQAFRTSTEAKNFCAIGSVKTNIGHLDAAAGIAGLLKTVLMLEHSMLPPSLHFRRPNPQIDFTNSPFYVNTRLAEWRTDGGPRRAGVSSFGIGGTNAHVVLEEAPAVERSGPFRPWQLLTLSARSDAALATAIDDLLAHVQGHTEQRFADITYTLQVGRNAFPHRLALVCRDRDDAMAALRARDPERVLMSIQESGNRAIAFVFPGLGDQYIDMALGLYQAEALFRECVDQCAELLKPHLGLDIREVLYPDGQAQDRDEPQHQLAAATTRESLDIQHMLRQQNRHSNGAPQKLHQTMFAQPILFTIEYALAKQWMAWGIQPQAVIGYSIGEYAAACIAGVFSLEDALLLVAKRAQLINGLPGGAMLSVLLSEEELRPLLGPKLSLMAINGPYVCVVSGPANAIAELERHLDEEGVACQRLQTSHAFHSWMMEPIVEPFARLARSIRLYPPKIPYISNVTGTWITTAQATDPMYWATHLRQPVRFADGVGELWKEPQRILLEVGPGQSLGSLALQHPKRIKKSIHAALSSLSHSYDRQPDLAFMLNTLGKLWLAGALIDWSQLYAQERRYRVPLPTYPFERQRYWIDPQESQGRNGRDTMARAARPPVAKWFYVPIWKQSTLPLPNAPLHALGQPARWLIFADACGVADQLAERLRRDGQRVVMVRPTERFSRRAVDDYTISACAAADYAALLHELDDMELFPTSIVHAWGVTQDHAAHAEAPALEATQATAFHSLLCLVQLLGQRDRHDLLPLWVVSNGLYEIESCDHIYPEKATVLGLCDAIPREYPHIPCRMIDIRTADAKTASDRLIDQLIAELRLPVADSLIAYRGRHRWAQHVEALRLDDRSPQAQGLRDDGVYLIVGGLGLAGLRVAEYLSQGAHPRLVLTGKPTGSAGELNHPADEQANLALRQVQALEQRGVEVLSYPLEQLDDSTIGVAISQTIKRFNNLHGVIYVAGADEQLADACIATLTYEAWLQRFLSLAEELNALERALQGRKLDFCLLCSSPALTVGGLAHAAAAANGCFMSARVSGHNLSEPQPWVSLSWDAHPPLSDAARGPATGLPTQAVISPEEGAQVLKQLLSNTGVTHAIVSPSDLKAGRAQMDDRAPSQVVEDGARLDAVQQLSDDQGRVGVAPRNEIEQAIADIWQRLLNIENIAVYDNFFEVGGHSLLAPQLLSQIRTAYDLELPLSILFERPTVAGLAETIDTARREGIESILAAQTVIDLRAEVALDPAINAAGMPFEAITDPAAILLTGATGFLGAYLVRELLDQTNAEIYCLVRASNAEEGRRRIQRNLEAYLLWDPTLADRIIPVPGDLAQLRWGLSEEVFRMLAGTIDSIYHCGAWVNFTYPYSALKAANVFSTHEALRLASQLKVKPVHYISSMAVFSPLPYAADSDIREDNTLDHAEGFFSGYAETKWVSEKIIELARQRGIPVCVYRPGVIGGHSQTGIGNTKDLIWNMIKGCIQLGVVPDLDQIPDIDTMIDIIPVDFLAKAITCLSRQPGSFGKNFHFTNPHPMHWSKIAGFLQEFGYPMQPVSNEEWHELLRTVVSTSLDNALYPFLPVLLAPTFDNQREQEQPEDRFATDLHFDDRNTSHGLAGTSIACPPVDFELMNTYFSHFVRSRFLAPPSVQSTS